MSPSRATDYRVQDTSLMQLVESGRSLSGLERNCCFLNLRQGRFADVSAVSGLDFEDDGRAIGLLDWDFDGKLDMWLVNRSGPQVRLLRNDSPPGHHFLSLKLRGTTSNRDAIGARVEVHLKGEKLAPQMRTLRAGEGFLSQSSKWVHFGLGTASEIERVVVRWPGGKTEEFTGLAADQQYLLVQGSGRAQPARPAAIAGRKPLAASPLPLTQDAPPRAVLGTRFLAPRLDYRTFDGKPAQLAQFRGKPLLLALWGSTCVPCGVELKELQDHQEQLRAAGLQVLALATDGLAVAADGSNRPTTPDDARAFAERMPLTLPAGLAEAQLLDKLQLMLDAMFGRDLSIGLPYSFLFDAQGQLAAVYRGPVKIDELLADVRLLPLSPAELRGAALPFPGRWANMPEADFCLHIARRLIDDGLDNEYEFVQANRARLSKDPDYARLLAFVADRQLQKGNVEAALSWCDEALAADPKLVVAHHLQGMVYHRSSRWAEAVAAFRKAAELDNKHLASQANLAWILATCSKEEVRNGKEAVRRAELVFSALRAPQPQVYDLLAAAYARDGRFDDAVEKLDEAIEKLTLLLKEAIEDDQPAAVLEQMEQPILFLKSHRWRYIHGQALDEVKPTNLGTSPFVKE